MLALVGDRVPTLRAASGGVTRSNVEIGCLPANHAAVMNFAGGDFGVSGIARLLGACPRLTGRGRNWLACGGITASVVIDGEGGSASRRFFVFDFMP